MVRIIEGNKNVSVSDANKEIQHLLGNVKAYLSQKGAVLAAEKDRYDKSEREFEVKGLGSVKAEILDSPIPHKGTSTLYAKVTISGSEKLTKGFFPENIKNILWLNNYFMGEHSTIPEAFDITKKEELPPIEAY
jgi:hypothetical protein